MIPEDCLNAFQGGETKKCISVLVKDYKMPYREAEKEFLEYRRLYIKDRSFFKKCVESKPNKTIAMKVSAEDHNYYTDEEIIEMYLNGMSMNDIYEEVGVASSTVFKILKKHNIGTRSRGRKVKDGCYLDDYKDDIVRLFNEGKTKTKIAKALDINIHTLYKYMYEKGLTKCTQ